MKILGIETSCDETGAAIIEGTDKTQPVTLLSNVLATSLAKHAETGGIIPEIAAREQVKYILPVIDQALEEGLGYKKTHRKKPDIDAIAVTYGPGLIGSLLVGVETVKTLSLLWNVPVIPANHLYGHIYANWIQTIHNSQLTINFPAVALVVSGGHTDLVYIEKHGSLKVIGGTRDDAAGEAFDKIGRLLGLSYPAGPTISRLALQGNAKAFQLPRPMWDSKDFDFSFSGLKTAVLNLIKKNGWEFGGHVILNPGSIGGTEVKNLKDPSVRPQDDKLLADLCASVQKAIVDVIVFKTFNAAREYTAQSLLLGGGVAANAALREAFAKEAAELGIPLYIPPANLCTDNGAMIAAAGFYNDTQAEWNAITADPELYY